MELLELETETLERLSASTSTQYITKTMVDRWLNMSMHWALSFKKWPMLESSGSDLIDSTGTYPYPTGMKTKSCFLITVGGKRFVKIRYEDYLKYKEDYPTGTDRVWAEYDRNTFINGNACSVGDAVIFYGIIKVSNLSGATDKTPFADAEDAGDEAIIRKAYAMGLQRYGDDQNLVLSEEKAAADILNMVYDRIRESAPREFLKNTKMFKRINVIKGVVDRSDPKNNIGNFG